MLEGIRMPPIAFDSRPVVSCVPQSPEVCQAIDGDPADAPLSIAAFSPDILVHFKPDHDNGVLYDRLPRFAVSVPFISIGDCDSLSAVDVPAHGVTGAAR